MNVPLMAFTALRYVQLMRVMRSTSLPSTTAAWAHASVKTATSSAAIPRIKLQEVKYI